MIWMAASQDPGARWRQSGQADERLPETAMDFATRDQYSDLARFPSSNADAWIRPRTTSAAGGSLWRRASASCLSDLAATGSTDSRPKGRPAQKPPQAKR